VPPAPPRLELDGAVFVRSLAGADLWRIALDRPAPGAAALLSEDERARAARYAFERDRARFVAGRAALRTLLAAYAGRPAQALTFALGAHGKPSLPGGPPFSFSNSQGAALCAVGGGRELGVDLERLRDVPDAAAVARSAFTPAELAAWRAAGGDGRAAFLRIWTRKEAVLKALGLGLGADPAADAAARAAVEVFDVELDPDHAAALAAVRGDHPAR
jgi:4'-phosphopantetheinyl transferase